MFLNLDPFWIKLIISFLVGGFYIGFLVVRSSERFGSVFGGILAGMPSTVLLSLLFIAWTQNTLAMWRGIPIIPLGLAVTVIYLMLFVKLTKYNKIVAFTVALSVWAAILIPFVLHGLQNLWLSLLLAAIVLTITIFILNRFPDNKPPTLKLNRKEIWFRFAVAGGIIAFSVLLAKIAGPLWGGLIASFPAAAFSAILLLIGKHGSDFAISFVKGTAYGIISNIVFLVLLFLLVPPLGLWAMIPALIPPAFYGIHKFRKAAS